MARRNTGYKIDYSQLPKPDRSKGIKELGYKKLEYTDYFFSWNEENSKYFPTLNNLAHAWGLKMDTIKNIYQKKGLKLEFEEEPLYKNKDWCIEQFIHQHKTVRQVANETGYKWRVLQKWVQEIYKLNIQEEHKKISPTKRQYSLIYGGILGDGCISTTGEYYVGHCEAQKEYLLWQRKELDSLCTGSYGIGWRTKAGEKYILTKIRNIQNFYQFNTRRLKELQELRESGRQIDIAIENLDFLGLSIYFLDDGSCSSEGRWTLCCGVLNHDQCLRLLDKIKELINIDGKIYLNKATQLYNLHFGKIASHEISSMIIKSIPNNLDVVKYKLRHYNSL